MYIFLQLFIVNALKTKEKGVKVELYESSTCSSMISICSADLEKLHLIIENKDFGNLHLC
jgi:hypothetical protein